MTEIEDDVRAALAAVRAAHRCRRRQRRPPIRASTGKLNVSIDYVIRGTNNQLNLVYPFYIKERG